MDFNALLDQNAGDVKPPARLVVGTYTWEIVARRFGKSSQKKTDYVEFNLKCIGYESDVDAGELPENWMGKVMSETFYITPDALSRLTDFLAIVNSDCVSMPVRDGIELVGGGGQFVKGHIAHRPYEARNGEMRVAVEFDGQWAKA